MTKFSPLNLLNFFRERGTGDKTETINTKNIPSMRTIDHQKLREFVQAVEKLRSTESPFEQTREALAAAPKGSDAHSKRIYGMAHTEHHQNSVARDTAQADVDKLLKEIDWYAYSVATAMHNALCQYR